MKKHSLSIAIIAIAVATASCGSSSSFDSDVRKAANFRCKIQLLEAKDPTDEKAKKELEAVQQEMKDFGQKMEKKYESKKDDKELEAKAEAIMKEIMDKCK